MTAAAFVKFLALGSMLLLVFALGLRSTAGDAEYLFHRPRLLARSLIAMYVLTPLVVISVLLQLHLRLPVKIALAALSLSPVPPVLPGKQMKLAARQGYIYGLLVAASLIAVVWLPLVTSILTAHFALRAHVSAAAILKIISLTVLLPLAAGIGVRRYRPERVAEWSRLLNTVGTALLLVAFIPVLAAEWRAMPSLVGNGTLLAIIAFTAVGLLIGHILGGPDPQNRTVLALATASRHPGVAMAIASVSFPEQRLVAPTLLLALIVGIIAAAPYIAWRRRVHAAAPSEDAGL